MVEIHVTMMTRGSLQKEVLKGLASRLDTHLGKNAYQLTVISAQGPNKDYLALEIERSLNGANVDLLISIGAQASIVTQNVLINKNRKIPLVFIGVLAPVECGLVDTLAHGTVTTTGVTITHDDKSIPAQLITNLKPELQSVFLSYHEDVASSRTEYEVKKVQKYFQDRSVTVFFHLFPKSNQLTDEMEKSIKKSEGVLIPEGALYTENVELLIETAKKHNVPVYGNTENLRENALFGVRPDIEFMGAKAGEYAAAIVTGKKKPSDLPILTLENTRRMIANPKAMQAHGISFSEDIITSHDQAEEFPEIPVKQFGKVMSYKNEFEDDLCYRVSKASRKDKKAVYFSEIMSGRIFDAEWQDAQTDFALESGQQLFFCIGKQLTNLMLHKMHKRNEHYPIVRICTKQEMAEPVSGAEHQPVKPMASIVLPDPDPLIPLKLLLLVKPGIKKAAVLCNIPANDLPPRYQHRLDTLKEFATSKGVDLTLEHEHVVFKLKTKLEQICQDHDAVLFFEDSIHEAIVDWFAKYGHLHNTLVCAGSSRRHNEFPLTYSMDKSSFAEQLFAPVRELLHGRTPPKDLYLSHDECFTISINAAVCKKYGIELSEGLEVLLSTRLVD